MMLLAEYTLLDLKRLVVQCFCFVVPPLLPIYAGQEAHETKCIRMLFTEHTPHHLYTLVVQYLCLVVTTLLFIYLAEIAYKTMSFTLLIQDVTAILKSFEIQLLSLVIST